MEGGGELILDMGNCRYLYPTSDLQSALNAVSKDLGSLEEWYMGM